MRCKTALQDNKLASTVTQKKFMMFICSLKDTDPTNLVISSKRIGAGTLSIQILSNPSISILKTQSSRPYQLSRANKQFRRKPLNLKYLNFLTAFISRMRLPLKIKMGMMWQITSHSHSLYLLNPSSTHLLPNLLNPLRQLSNN